MENQSEIARLNKIIEELKAQLGEKSAVKATRTEADTFGPLEVPGDRYWGA